MANTNWQLGIHRIKGFSAVAQILLLNGVIFLLANLFANLSSFDLAGYLSMPSGVSDLARQFYSPITYMFTHVAVMHIIFNLIYFYFMGQIFGSIVGEKRLWFTYLMGGLAGAVFYFVVANLFFDNSFLLLGASASVTAVAVGAAVYAPDLRMNLLFIGEVPLKWIVLIFFLLNTAVDLSVNTGGKVAHLGGAVFGLAYCWQLRKGKDWMSVFKRKPGPSAEVRKMQSAQKKVENEEKTLNEILDKINRSGYDSLSRSEKETLQKIASKK